MFKNTFCSSLVDFKKIYGKILKKRTATHPNCGNLLRDISTPLLNESLVNTQGNDLGHSNNEMYWIIRIQAPKYDID